VVGTAPSVHSRSNPTACLHGNLRLGHEQRQAGPDRSTATSYGSADVPRYRPHTPTSSLPRSVQEAGTASARAACATASSGAKASTSDVDHIAFEGSQGVRRSSVVAVGNASEDFSAGPEIAESVLDLIGNTPLVKLGRLARTHQLACTLAAKLETTNPGGSSKDRPALEMVLAAERDGLLRPGGTIVEPTSGNTGVGLAIVAAQRGYHCHFVTTDKVAPEKIDLLRAYGAEVTVCPVAVPPDHPDSYYSTAERLVKEIPGAFRPNQYANPANPLSHEKTTGPEIWRQTAGRVTHFVAGAGTCGTITGVARYLKRVGPAVQVVAADPEGSVFSGGSGRPYLIEGVGEDFFPEAWDPSVLDQVVACSDEEAYLMARQVAKEEGILLGSSGGLAVAAAIKVARDLPADALVVVLIPDSGRGYLSRVFNDEWMATYGFLRECDLCVGAVLDARSEDLPALLYVNPEQTVREAVALMRSTGVSQLPVCKNDPPFAAAEVAGAVDELELMDAAYRDPSVLDTPVDKVMGSKLPTIGFGQPLSRAVEMLDRAPALLVLAGGRPLSVLTRTDVLTFLSPTAAGSA
jgi:cystathionine beta-synthase